MPDRTVLTVDDSEDDVVMLHAACRSAKVSFGCQSVDGGEKALQYLQAAEPYADRARFPFPDLLLLDLKMPGTSGFDVLEWLRSQANPPLRHLPVVVFTSSMHDEDITRAFQFGADVYLVKPSNFDYVRQMVSAIDTLLSRSDVDLAELRNLPDAKLSGNPCDSPGSPPVNPDAPQA